MNSPLRKSRRDSRGENTAPAASKLANALRPPTCDRRTPSAIPETRVSVGTTEEAFRPPPSLPPPPHPVVGRLTLKS